MTFCMAKANYHPMLKMAPVHIGDLIRATNSELGMQLKEVSAITLLDQAQLSRGLEGQAALDLWHISLMPMRWWRVFLMKLSSALIVAWFDAQVEDVSKERRSA